MMGRSLGEEGVGTRKKIWMHSHIQNYFSHLKRQTILVIWRVKQTLKSLFRDEFNDI